MCYKKQKTQREEICGEPNEQYKISENASSDEVNKIHQTIEGYFCHCCTGALDWAEFKNEMRMSPISGKKKEVKEIIEADSNK